MNIGIARPVYNPAGRMKQCILFQSVSESPGQEKHSGQCRKMKPGSIRLQNTLVLTSCGVGHKICRPNPKSNEKKRPDEQLVYKLIERKLKYVKTYILSEYGVCNAKGRRMQEFLKSYPVAGNGGAHKERHGKAYQHKNADNRSGFGILVKGCFINRNNIIIVLYHPVQVSRFDYL